jgi:hypothetical protein
MVKEQYIGEKDRPDGGACSNIYRHPPITMLEMRELSEILSQIRGELRLLYRELAEKLIPVEEPEPDERRAIEEEDELASEDELFKALEE